MDRALTALLEQIAREKFGDTDRPRRGRKGRDDTRYIPVAVRRAVWLRDLGRCTFVGKGGHRCDERGFLEFHHIVPFAAGGRATVENLSLRCSAHTRHEADVYFGERRSDVVCEPVAAYGVAGTESTEPGLRELTTRRPAWSEHLATTGSRQPFSWRTLGVDIRGRSRTLRVNYGTSHQIRQQADRLLGPETD